jgi:hypothetical protein
MRLGQKTVDISSLIMADRLKMVMIWVKLAKI